MVRFVLPLWLICVVRATPLCGTEARCHVLVGALALVSGPRFVTTSWPRRGALAIAYVCALLHVSDELASILDTFLPMIVGLILDSGPPLDRRTWT